MDYKNVITSYNTKFKPHSSSKDKTGIKLHTRNMTSGFKNNDIRDMSIKIINTTKQPVDNINHTKSFEISNIIGDMINFGGKSRNQRNTLGVAKSSSILNSDKIQQSNSYSNKNQIYTQMLNSINIAKTIKIIKKPVEVKKDNNSNLNAFINTHLKSLKLNPSNKGIR